MRITDLQVIPFRAPRRPYRNGQFLPETTVIQTITKIVTDAGALSVGGGRPVAPADAAGAGRGDRRVVRLP